MKPCVFCGTTVGHGSDEHVIPQWVRRAFDVRGVLTLYATDEPALATRRRVGDLQHLNIKLRGEVCRECNTGDLSRLEAAVRPILSPMMLSAEPATLDLGQQRLLATWAVKTVFLLELAIRQKYPARRAKDGYAASGQEFAWLWAKQEPPPRSLVWLGCWDCRQTTPVMFEPSGAPLPTTTGAPVVGHLTTFSLGFVAFQVFTVDFVAAEQHEADPWNTNVPPALEPALVPIWPPRGRDVSWPPHAFANQEWARLVSWDGVLRPQGIRAGASDVSYRADPVAGVVSPRGTGPGVPDRARLISRAPRTTGRAPEQDVP